MNRDKLLQIIQKNLAELSDINHELIQNKQLSKFEIDLALNKAKMIHQEYEFLLEIYQQDAEESVREQATTTRIPDPEPAVAESKNEEPVFDNLKAEETLPAASPKSTVEEVVEVEDKIRKVILEETKVECAPENAETTETSLNEETDEQMDIEIPEPVLVHTQNPVPGNNGAKTTATEKKTLTDQFHSTSLNDLLSSANKLDQRFANSPILKLESAIGLNDRFQYTRELFRNDAELFRTTISQIDRMHTIEEAVTFLDGQFNWEKDDTSLKFIHLVKRRFTN
ncbi:hypothetical protein [Mangrovibacterium sp.]|uniref:hypothetical protein n=1 Tax=Mangrovibacterium sp. TaxID=1961364 RepID=UPI0035653DF1